VVSPERARDALAPAAAAAAVLGLAGATHHRAPVDLAAALVLAPLACLAAGRLGRRLAGPRYGVAAQWVYVLMPALGYVYALGTYRHTFLHGGLPQLVGLHEPQWLALGVALAAVAAFAPETSVGALGAIAVVVALVTWGTGGLHDLRNGLHETAWSIAFAEWTFVAGVVGVAVRRPLLALGVGGWAAAVILGAAHAGYGSDGEFWRALAPAAPALALLLTSIALLLPRLRLAAAPRPSAD
jgi:hypothetical protein